MAGRIDPNAIGEAVAQDMYAPITLPSLSAQTQGPGLPQISGGYSVPFAGGDLGITGQYTPQQGGDNRIRLQYRRQF
jgi:hypothetical protein